MASGVESLVRLLLHDPAFSRAVQQKDGETAAAAAVGVVKSHFKAFANVLRPPAPNSTAILAAAQQQQTQTQQQLAHADSGSPTAARRLGGGGGAGAAGPDGVGGGPRRSSDAGGKDIRIKDRVVINASSKKYEDVFGKQGTVLSVKDSGWVRVQVGNEVIDIHMRHVSLAVPRTPAAGAAGAAAAVGGSNAAAAAAGGAAGGGRGAALGGRRGPEVIKQLRRELLQMEEEVPWKEVVDRWKAVRQRWSKAIKAAESPQQFAGLMAELHDHLRTDKSSGLFATGGPWESALMACVKGDAGMNQLLGLWEEMRGALQAWLVAGNLPGGLDALDRYTYEQAVATYTVLQEAASRGLEALEQVPLDQILTTQRDVLALQHVIQRELAATHSRLQAVASAPTLPPAAQQPPPLLPQDWATSGLNESLLMHLGKLPRLAAAGGAAGGAGGGADTDQDVGSEATDVGDLEPMDIATS